MRASRLLKLLLMLQMRGRLSARDLARELEVSTRTVYRDLDALSASGVPVYADVGRGGGVRLHEGYRTRLTGLTPDESSALPLAGLPRLAKELGLGSDAATAQLKVLAGLPTDSGQRAQRLSERFLVDPQPWYHRAETIDCLPQLAVAVWQDRRIEIVYAGWRGSSCRRLDPLGLVHKGGAWYLVAATSRGVRTFRASSIRRLSVLPEQAERPPGFDLTRHWTEAAEAFEQGLLSGQAQVRISDEGLRVLRAVMPMAADRVDASRRPAPESGWWQAQLPFETPEYSARQLLRLGCEVEVLAPEALRAAVRAEAQRVLSMYGTASAASVATPAGAVKRKR